MKKYFCDVCKEEVNKLVSLDVECNNGSFRRSFRLHEFRVQDIQEEKKEYCIDDICRKCYLTISDNLIKFIDEQRNKTDQSIIEKVKDVVEESPPEEKVIANVNVKSNWYNRLILRIVFNYLLIGKIK